MKRRRGKGSKVFMTSDFYCTKCGNRGIPITRTVGGFREPGHLKKIYCIHCKEETNHSEIKPIGTYRLENFKEEFELGRFLNQKRVPVSELKSCKHIDCKYNKNGKCWDAGCKCSSDFRKNIVVKMED